MIRNMGLKGVLVIKLESWGNMSKSYFNGQIFNDLKVSEQIYEDYEFFECEFINCNFYQCQIIGCTFLECTFNNCTIAGMIFSNFTSLRYVEFIRCNLVSINWSELLPSNGFADPIKRMVDCNLKFNSFSHLNLNKFNFNKSTIIDSMFSECMLVESCFTECKLEKTEYFKCDLRKANFTNATGYCIDIMTNKLMGAKFSFPEVVNLLNGLKIKIK